MRRCLRFVIAVSCLLVLSACGGGGAPAVDPAGPPTITTQPADQTVADGQPASFSVVASGAAPFSYQWRQGSTAIAGATQATLTLAGTLYAFHNGLQYGVAVTDANGVTIQSSVATLTVTPLAPRLTQSPMGQTVVQGSTATFSAAAAGTLPLSYQWQRNGSAIAGATAPSYTTGTLSRAADDGSSYAVVVTNGAGQAVTSAAAALAVPQSADTRITVDCTQADAAVAHQVSYRRGLVQGFDLGGQTPQQIVGGITGAIGSAGANLLTATLDLNDGANAALFSYTAGSPPALVPNVAGTAPVASGFRLLRAAVAASAMPALVQLSGTPWAFSDYLDTSYKPLCSGGGNFYPLPQTGTATTVAQGALQSWIGNLNAVLPGAIWIGTQEPTHTLGFQDSASCSDPNAKQRAKGELTNIQRYIAYWAPIAQALRDQGLRVGGIQLNAANSAEYDGAAQQIIAAQMKLDYFTIQNYNPSSDVTGSLYAAWQNRFALNPDYQQVKVILDRYGTTKDSSYASAGDVIDFLRAESLLMPYADMLYGYAFETAGVLGNASLLPQVLQWLQRAPSALRPLSPTTSDLQAFALVQSGTPNRAWIAIWNVSPTRTAYTTSVLLSGLAGQFSARLPTVLKVSGQGITTLNDPAITLNGNILGGLTLNQGEALLVSIE